jgi:ferredoxin
MNSSFDLYDILFLATGNLILVMFLITAVVSYFEKEFRAARRSLLLCLALLPIISISFIEFPFQNIVEIILMALFFLAGFALLIPINNFSKIQDYKFISRIDERDIMFSRNELKNDGKEYNNYYDAHPEKKNVDDNIREKPGILAKETTFYNEVLFASAKATFKTVECFPYFLRTKPAEVKSEIAPEIITNYIKAWANQLGAVDCGVTLLKDYHKYSHTGRRGNYGDKVELNHKFAIAFTVEMSKSMMASAPAAPTVMESAQQYLNAGNIAMQIAFFIKELGHEALAHIDGNYQVICPLVAKDAGLGEIGRMGLLMTPKLGPRVRIAVVTTDLPLIVDKACFEPSVIDFCNICKKCANTCPGNAISKNNMQNIDGQTRWQINQEACFNYWVSCGTDCGRCMSVCPYSHPNNLLHNLVRIGSRNSYLFRRFALKADDFLYGRKPISGKIVEWIRKSLAPR